MRAKGKKGKGAKTKGQKGKRAKGQKGKRAKGKTTNYNFPHKYLINAEVELFQNGF